MRPRLMRLAAAGAVLVFLSACGAATGPTGDSPGAKDGVIRVGETDGVPAAFLHYGQDRGFFKKHGITLKIDASAGGAAAIPALVGGNLDIAGSNAVSSMLAVEKGLPLRMIAPGTFATDDVTSDFSAVLPARGSKITSPEDLAGATIAVNTLENIGDITVKAALEKRGVDTSDITFVELAFPDMLPALENGQVDAAWIIEPFLTKGLKQGFKPVLRPYVESREELQVGAYLTSEPYAEKHGHLVKAFQAAVADTAEAITRDPQSFREALPELQELDPKVANAMVLPQFKSDLDRASLQFLADQMLESGFVDEEIDVASFTAS